KAAEAEGQGDRISMCWRMSSAVRSSSATRAAMITGAENSVRNSPAQNAPASADLEKNAVFMMSPFVGPASLPSRPLAALLLHQDVVPHRFHAPDPPATAAALPTSVGSATKPLNCTSPL